MAGWQSRNSWAKDFRIPVSKRRKGKCPAGHNVYATLSASDAADPLNLVRCQDCNAHVTAVWDEEPKQVTQQYTVHHPSYTTKLVPGLIEDLIGAQQLLNAAKKKEDENK